jgi:hypothetical protein
MGKLERAARLYADFTGREPPYRVARVHVPQDDAGLLIGQAEAIAYNTIRDGKRGSYIHEFRTGSRPALAVSHDGKRLYLLGGAYEFTDRGIEDRRQMSSIALVHNPSGRKGRKMATKRTGRRRRWGSPKQRAALSKLLAWNRQHRRRSGAPKSKSSRYVNPFGHHKHKAKHHRRASNPSHHRHHRRRNPIVADVMSRNFWMGDVMPATLGAGAAIGADLLIGYLPLPTMLQSGFARQLTRLAGVVGLGSLAAMAISKRTAMALTAGGVAVVLYDIIKGQLVSNFPTLPLQPVATVVLPTTQAGPPASAAGTAGWISPAPTLGYEGESDYNYEGMGSYVDGMGEVGSYVAGVEVRAY